MYMNWKLYYHCYLDTPTDQTFFYAGIVLHNGRHQRRFQKDGQVSLAIGERWLLKRAGIIRSAEKQQIHKNHQQRVRNNQTFKIMKLMGIYYITVDISKQDVGTDADWNHRPLGFAVPPHAR